MSDKKIYPTFARTVAPAYRTAPFFAAIMTQHSYNRVAIFYSSDRIQVLSAVAMKEQFRRDGIELAVFHVFEPGPSGNEQEFINLQSAMEKTRGT